MTDRPKLFLLDGSALAYRSHFAFINTPLTNDKGLNTGGIFGFTRALLKILDDESPTHMAVVFDHPKPTFRHEMFSEYKATRQKMPEDMREQIPYMKDITEALGIPLLEIEGWEADDVIGTLARTASESGFFVNIVSGDKDFMQIVTPHVNLYDIMKMNVDLVIVDEARVQEKFGVPPSQVIDVLALMGDKSDNVPGVTGIGEKTAISLIQEHGSVEGVLDAIEGMTKKKLKENLTNERDLALLSKSLVTIDCDAPVGVSASDLEVEESDRDAFLALCKELRFASLMQGFAKKTQAPVEKDYRIIKTQEALDGLLDDLRGSGGFVVDLETTHLDAQTAEIVGVAFSWKEGAAWYVPCNAEPPLIPDPPGSELIGRGVLEYLRPVLEDASIPKCGQNIKYDIAVMARAGIDLEGLSFDTMLASYLLEPGGRDHDLDSLALKHFDYAKIKTTELLGKGKEQLTMDLLPIDDVGEYAAEDADYTCRLWKLFEARLAERDLRDIFDRIEVPLVPVLARVEGNGVRLDAARLKNLENELGRRIEELAKEIYELAGRDFNIASPKQLGELLFEELELHKELGIKPKKTKTGYSTNHEVLEKMRAHPLPDRILEHRSLTKLMSTYVLTLPKNVNRKTERIHTSYNQAVAATGRLSSNDPNLQNIPIRTEMGRRIREAFVPTNDDWVFLSCDYSQIELRLMAHVSGDPDMIDAFRRGADIHAETASKIFEVDPSEVDTGMRSKAKNINFGILYGMGPQRLGRETGLSHTEAVEFIERYFAMFPSVRDYLEGSKEQARKSGVVTTLLGRQRPIADIHSKNGRLRAAAENMAVNTPIQGTAADIIKMAMIEIDRWMRRADVEGKMILQVHDELVFDVPRTELETFRTEVPRIMSGVIELKVPLTVDTGDGDDWSAAH